MAGFRVEEHRRWRAPPTAPTPRPGPTKTRAAPARTALRAADTVSPQALDRERTRLGDSVRALGPLGWPARTYDLLFGAWHQNGFTFFAARFLLVLAAVALCLGGALGDDQVVYENGTFRSVTPATVIDTYVTDQSVHIVRLDIQGSDRSQPYASFSQDDGEVRVPQLGAATPTDTYALKIQLVRKDPSIRPDLLLSSPGESPRSLVPTSDDTVTVDFAPIPLKEAGGWQVITRTHDSAGHVELRLSVAKAPLHAVEVPDMRYIQIAGGGILALVLLGAYTPGAAALRQRRRIEREWEDAEWATRGVKEAPKEAHGFARTSLARRGVLAWRRPGKDVPERLADMPGSGWVIRLD